MSSRARLGIVILAVRDLAASQRFYDGVFGWDLMVDVPTYKEYALPDQMRFGIYDRDGFARNTGEPPHRTPPHESSATELYFYVSDPQEHLARAAETGGRTLSPLETRAWGDEVGYVADPDGNVVAIARAESGAVR